MAQKQYKKSEHSKKAILDAAHKLAIEKGFEKTSIQDIVKESGLSVGSFYHHFESKDDVLSASFLDFDSQLTSEAFEVYDTMGPIAAIKAVLLDQTRFVEEVGPNLMREYYRALLQGKDREAVDPGRHYYRAVQKYVKKAQKQGLLVADKKSGVITDYLVRCVRGTLIDWCLHEGAYPAAKRVEDEFDCYLLPFLSKQ